LSNVKIKLNDKAFKELKKNLKSARVKVGLPKGTPDRDDGMSMIELGAIHEFGSHANNIPERSFIRETLNTKQQEYMKFATSQARRVILQEQSISTAIENLGIWGQREIKKKFINNNWQPNAPLTAQLKGSSRPLIDTGALRQAITWEVAK